MGGFLQDNANQQAAVETAELHAHIAFRLLATQ
jgi:hypothetical protein